MTVVAHDQRDQYTATGGQTVFNYTFEVAAATDLKVYQRAAGSEPDDSTDLLTYITDYTVTGVGGNNGGTVVLVTGATVGDIITIQGGVAVSRSTSFTPNGLIRAEDLNTEFDNQTLIAQKIQSILDDLVPQYARSAVIAAADKILPILGASQTWVKNAGDTAIEAVDFPANGAADKDGTYVTITDETANEPNSFALSAIGSGVLINNVGGGASALLTRTFTGTANQIDVTNGSGVGGNPIFSIATNPILPGTAGMGIPQGTTAQRVTPSSGIGLRYNTDLLQIEYYDGSSWTQLEDSTDIATLLALLASHTAGEGASLVGLEDQGSVSNKTVQDFSEASFIAKIDNGTLPNAQFLGALATGILKSTTTTGNLSISAPLTSIDGLTTAANNLIYTTASNTYGVIAAAANSVLVTDGSNVPSLSSTLPTAVQDNITRLGTQAEALNMGTQLINNVVDPVSAQDAATKNYVDQVALSGTSVYAATTATLNATQSGAGVGATLTDASGTFAAFSTDGVSPPLGSDILNKDQAAAANQGIYTLTRQGDGVSIPWQLTRATTYNTPSEINLTGLITVRNGSTLAGTAWYNSSTIVTVDTTAFSYSRFGLSTPVSVANGGTGLTALTAHYLIIGNGTSAATLLAPSATSGVPLISQGSSADPTYGTAVVAGGGTGATTFTAYAPICGGTTATGALQSVSSVGTSGQVLTSNGAGALPTFQTLSKISTVKQTLLSSSQTWTPTANAQFIWVRLQGPGGGSGGSTGGGAGTGSASGGGAAGGYAEILYTAAQLGANASYVHGALGTGGASGNNAGNAGGNSSFTPAGSGSALTANGGAGGSGAGSTAGIGITGAAVGGLGSGGTINMQGGYGGVGYVLTSSSLTVGGNGGASQMSPGIPGRVSNGNAGGFGSPIGYGGGGGGVSSSSTSTAGVNGDPGVCIIIEFI